MSRLYIVTLLIYLNAEYIMLNARLDEAQAEIKIARRNTNSLRYADDTLMTESEELKNLLMKVKEESEKVGLVLNIEKTKIMASGPITSWQINGETVSDFILQGSKITADDDFSRSVLSNSLRPHELQHARPPCPSPAPGVHSNSCPSGW